VARLTDLAAQRIGDCGARFVTITGTCSRTGFRFRGGRLYR